MSRRNVAFSRPEEPSFLKRIKEQVGYKEGPTVDTKREDAGPLLPEDLEDSIDEQPTVVVLGPGDLTAEEAEQLQKEEEEKPADLSAPIVFKAPKKKTEASTEVEVPAKRSKKENRKNKKEAKTKSLLSFDEDENDD